MGVLTLKAVAALHLVRPLAWNQQVVYAVRVFKSQLATVGAIQRSADGGAKRERHGIAAMGQPDVSCIPHDRADIEVHVQRMAEQDARATELQLWANLF